jgi:hypothetical protein
MQMKKVLPLAAAFAVFPAAAFANDPPGNLDDVGYIFTTLLFLVGGFLVFWMAAGFAMLEAGLVRSKNTTMQLTKNIALFSIAAIMYWFMGFNLMYPGDGNWWIDGWLGPFFSITWLEPVGLAAEDAALDYASTGSDFFFQLMFCATTASIVSGTLAERIKLWPFLIFTVVVLTGVIYPIQASWQWGGGWLDSQFGFLRFRRLDPGPLGGRLGRAGRAPSSLARGSASSARTGRSTRSRVRTWRSPRSAPSSCGSAGSASTAARSWPWARSGDVPTSRASSPTPTWRRPAARWPR